MKAIAGQDADLLEAAAILHEVGYAPDLATTGFHPLDGASYLAEIGAPARLVNLVAHHSYALLEAELRGLGAEMTRFTDERGVIRDALWYCDQTTSPSGEVVTPQARVAEIQHRYGPGHIVTRFIIAAAPSCWPRCSAADGERYRKYVSAQTYEEAQQKWFRLRDQARQGPVASDVPRLADFLGYWLSEIVRPNLAPKTCEKYKLFSRLHIIPHLGAMHLDKIQVKEIRQWLNKLGRICQ
jgi:hypothetical protein